MLWKRKKADILKIIFDEELEKLIIQKLEVKDPKTAEYVCDICHRTITFNEIGGIKFKGGKLKVICERCL